MAQNWQGFYQLTGAAAGSLIGLMFIVATLTQTRRHSGIQQGVKLFTSPTVLHLTAVLIFSALALAPPSEWVLTWLADGVAAGLGLAYAVVVALRIFMIPRPTHWSDAWWYGSAPVAAYAALTAAQAARAWRVSHAEWAIAIALLVLLTVAIRNAWDLVTWLAPRRDDDAVS